MLGILYALITVLAWGTWLAPSQNIPLKDQQIRVFYVASVNLLLAFIIGLVQGLDGLTGSVFWMPFIGGLVGGERIVRLHRQREPRPRPGLRHLGPAQYHRQPYLRSSPL